MSLKRDNLEVTTNMILGALINYLLTMLLFGVSAEFALGTTGIFFMASYARSFAVRRAFRKSEDSKKMKQRRK